ncbi:MAG TPA: hypothetical protein ENN43_03800 [bacterium]|nr:hypothetical protein [bacterium]
MSQVEQNVIEAILKYVKIKGGNNMNWYVGVSKDPERSMFKEHNVDKTKNPWMYKSASDNLEAVRIEEYLLKLGFDGASIVRDVKATGVYVYRKAPNTKE